MAYNRSDIKFLLIVLLCFCCGIGLLYGQKSDPTSLDSFTIPKPPEAPQEKKVEPEEVKKGEVVKSNPLAYVSAKEAADQVAAYAQTRSFNKMSELLQGLPIEKVVEIVKLLLDIKQSSLTRNDKIKFIFSLMLNYPENMKAKFDLLDFLIRNKELLPGDPILFIAALDFPSVIPAVLSWLNRLHKKRKKLPEELKEMVDQAIMYILNPPKDSEKSKEIDYPKILDNLFSYGVSIPQEDADEYLWYVVDNNKNPAFVKILVERGANVNAPQTGYTPLIKAVENNNEGLVHALVENKANINEMLDPKIGTALQMAIEKGFAKIDEYLRKHGAREEAQFEKKPVLAHPQ